MQRRRRRLLRIFLNTATALSLTLCLWTGTLWVRSLLDGNYFDTPHIVHLGALPAYQVAAISALLPIMWCSFRLIRPRYRSGRCTRCGYDLRATRDRCPECGRPAPAQWSAP